MPRKSLRDKKKETTRERLIEVATELFLTKGFDSTTIDEIVEKAGISQRSFFRYFPTKEAVVFHDQPRRMALYKTFLTAGSDSIPPFERIKNCVALIGDDYHQSREVLLTEFNVVKNSPHLQVIDISVDVQLEKLMAQCLRYYRGKTYLSARQSAMAGAAIFGGLRVMAWEWNKKGGKPSVRVAVRECTTFIDGLAVAFQPADSHGARSAATVRPTTSAN